MKNHRISEIKELKKLFEEGVLSKKNLKKLKKILN